MSSITVAVGTNAKSRPSALEQMTRVFVFIDDWLKFHPGVAEWRRSNNAHPLFSDSEVLTVALMQSVLGVATLKRAYQIVAADYRSAFPHLPTYEQWIARLHQLTAVVGALIHAAVLKHKMPGRFYILDSKPVPLCKPIRHGRVRLLRDEGAYFGKNSIGWFFGFKLHALVHSSGVVLAIVLTPANWSDRAVAVALCASVQGGTALGDHGYRGKELALDLATQTQMLLVTPDAAGDDKKKRALISSIRERVETCFSSLWSRFIDRVFSRSWEGLWNTVKLKVLHFNFCQVGILPA
jgi:transposase